MKSISNPTVHLAIGMLTVLAVSSAQAEKGKFYLEGDAGAVVTVDTELNEFFGATLAPNTQVSFDPGFRLAVRGGYGVTDWFDAEVETGFMVNEIDSITGATVDDATLSNFPLMLNARFQCPALHRISPYFGGGFGFSTTILDADSLVIDNISMYGTTAGIEFAYQAFAGLRFAINDRMGLSLEYHYFATLDSEMSADVTTNVSSDTIRFGGTASHTATIAFDYRF